MTIRSFARKLSDIAWLNVALTNRVPRRSLTNFVGWLSKIEHPIVRDTSIAIWRLFSDLDLSEAKKAQFDSLHDCFIRQLKDGVRPVDQRPEVIVSPCDAIVGSSGTIKNGIMLQVKGSTYRLSELVRSENLVRDFCNGTYVTLRLTASMYHRFHAPYDGRITSVAHIAGDTWNVNPPTLARVPRVFCRNERAIITLSFDGDRQHLVLVPVAAILVAGLKLNFLEMPPDRAHRDRWEQMCDVTVRKGDELGWFEHGSTIIVLTASRYGLAPTVETGQTIKMGQPLLIHST